MRFFLTGLLVLALAVPAFAASGREPFDLQKTPWGMAREDVAKMLNVQPYAKGNDPITFKANVSGREAGIIYVFHKGKLAAVNVQFVKGLDASGATDLVGRLHKALSERYGAPHPNEFGCAFERQCTYSKWNKDDSTFVVLEYQQEKGRRVTVAYVSREAHATSLDAAPSKHGGRRGGKGR